MWIPDKGERKPASHLPLFFPQGFFTHRLSNIYFSPADFKPTDFLTKYF